jgi:hypothetical protein
MGRKKHDLKNEKDLCDRFSELARGRGWSVYPETSDCDLLLVATNKTTTRQATPGMQIAVEAKMQANVTVLRQAMPAWHGDAGPDFHVALVPTATSDFRELARRLQVEVYETHPKRKKDPTILDALPLRMKQYYGTPLWYPDIELWTPAGVRSPTKITPWKVKAINLCLDCLERGFLTSSDFRNIGMSMTRWVQNKWIKANGKKQGRAWEYVLNEEAKPPHIKYADVAQQIRLERVQAASGEKTGRRPIRT